MKTLFNIDKYLSNYPSQLIITIFGGYLYTETLYTKMWILIGLFVYFALWTHRTIKDKDYLIKLLKDSNKPNFYLGLLKGFNYTVVLGPLSIPLLILLNLKKRGKDV